MTMLATFTHRISQTLHDEHRATIALVERLEQLIARHRRGLPDVADRTIAQLLSDLSTGIEGEVERHFAFEEAKIFGYLAEIGDNEISVHLTDEHNAMRPLGKRVASLAREGAKGFDRDRWDEFCRLGQELAERMLAHIQKEEMALLPLLDEMLDSETDARLFQDYAENA
jgi:hemerythrin-like domain-containing protein